MNVKIGKCSICGGAVMAWEGIWMSINPPPPPECSSCGAHPKGASNIIEMDRAAPPRPISGPGRFISSSNN